MQWHHIFLYLVSLGLFLCGLATIRNALRKRSAMEVCNGKGLPIAGRGSKQYLVFLGARMIVLAVIVLVKVG